MNQDSFLFRGEVEDSKKTATKRSFKEVKKAFRDAFGELGSLRSLMPSVPLLALTATANKVTERKIVKSLGIRNFTMLRVSPNRLNIRLSKMKVAKLTPSILNWVVDGLRQEHRKDLTHSILCKNDGIFVEIIKLQIFSRMCGKYFPQFDLCPKKQVWKKCGILFHVILLWNS